MAHDDALLSISLALALFPAVRPSHAAKRPHAKRAEEGTIVWTNEDLERLRPNQSGSWDDSKIKRGGSHEDVP